MLLLEFTIDMCGWVLEFPISPLRLWQDYARVSKIAAEDQIFSSEDINRLVSVAFSEVQRCYSFLVPTGWVYHPQSSGPWSGSNCLTTTRRTVFFPKASPMLGFSFSLLEGGVERGLTGPWCGRDLGGWSGMGVIRDGCEIRDVVEDGGAVIRDGCDTGRVWYRGCCGRWRSGVDRGWGCGWNTEKERDWVWTGVDKGVDGRWRGARLGVDGCGWGRGWKMEGSETGCGRVWTGVWMEDGGERDWVRTGVDKGVDGRWRRARPGVDWCGQGCGWKMEQEGEDWVWTGVRMEDEEERDWVSRGVDGGLDGRQRGARQGVDGRGRGCGWECGWKTEGSEIGCGRVWTGRLGVKRCGRGCGWKRRGARRETGCGRVWTGVWMEDAGERDWVWMGVDKGVDGRWRGARLGEDWVWMEDGGERDWVQTGVDGRRGARLGADGCGQGCGWKMKGSETGCGRVWMEDGGERDWKMKGSEIGRGRVWSGVSTERGVDVGGQRPCTKHVSGLVWNMLRCGLKYSKNWGWRGCRWRWSWGKGV